MIFSNFIQWCNHSHNSVLEQFPHPSKIHLPITHCPRQSVHLTFSLLPFLTTHSFQTIHGFYVWLLTLYMKFLKFIHVLTHVNSSFFFIAKYYLLNGYSTFCRPTHQARWRTLVSSVWLWKLILLWTITFESLWGHVFGSQVDV